MGKTKVPEYEPELITPDGEAPYYLSDDGSGVLIAWDRCHAFSGGCGKNLLDCICKNGPVEPYYITRWRVEAQGGVWKPVKNTPTSIGRSPATAVRKPKAESGMSLSSFIDADVIAKVKAAKEAPRDPE